jgi:hypothetical protein
MIGATAGILGIVGGLLLGDGPALCDKGDCGFGAFRSAAEARAIKDECPPVHGGGLLR